MTDKAGLKIRTIKAASLYGYSRGLRDRYECSDSRFHQSLFSLFIQKNGLRVTGKDSTRDIVCLDFDFGFPSCEEETARLKKLLKTAPDEESAARIRSLMKKVLQQQDLYEKKTKDELRKEFYEQGVFIPQQTPQTAPGGNAGEAYRMLYRNASKAKAGQAMFIRSSLYAKTFDWLTMGLGSRMPKKNAKIVELSAYAPLVTSAIVDTLHIPVDHILILRDQDSFFETVAEVVRADDSGLSKKCLVERRLTQVKNTLWDGMALVESELFPSWAGGMLLLRNHFFKACGFKTRIRKFFQDWCETKGRDFEAYEITDMFGASHRLKDIQMITTDNAVKWIKFTDLMGGSLPSAYRYWCDRVRADGSVFGIVKTDHESRLGDVQQMSYQMINTLPCTKDDIEVIAETSIRYVETLKNDNDAFERYLRQNATSVNHFEMLADLYRHNPDFSASRWFKAEKAKILNGYTLRLRKGKIAVPGDNLTICGNPYGLLLYCIGEDFAKDPTLNYESGAIQCFTERFADHAYLAAFRSPHNSPNNLILLHNHYSPKMHGYFPFGPGIIAVNCIKSDIQDRGNGLDFDSDFFFVTDHPAIVAAAKTCYDNFPTVVNRLKESGITYENTPAEYARMDSRFAKTQRTIGEASNLAQLAMTYYWTHPTRELYDNFIILSVLAQVVIDGCKREYEIDAPAEIERIKRLNSMNPAKNALEGGDGETGRRDFPEFMLYTKEIPLARNGVALPDSEIREKKEKLKSRINRELVCPMNWLEECLDQIPGSKRRKTLDTEAFFVKHPGKANDRQMAKIRGLVEEYDWYVKENRCFFDTEEGMLSFSEETERFLKEIGRIKIKNPVTVNRLIETALGLDRNAGGPRRYRNATKYTRKMLNLLYRTNKEHFLDSFLPSAQTRT